MDMIFICRDALENSLISNLVMAIEAKKDGINVGVIFTQEALAALAGETFSWSPLLQERGKRLKIAQGAKKMEIPMISARDARQTDVWNLVNAAAEAGVALFACPVWQGLLGLEEKLPSQIQKIQLPEALKLLTDARKVIGTF